MNNFFNHNNIICYKNLSNIYIYIFSNFNIMTYIKIISYIYAIIAIILGTYFSIYSLKYYISEINFYNNKQLIETIGIIKKIYCYDKNSCYYDIEYTANNTKYVNDIDIPDNLKVGDKIKIKYNSKAERDIYYYKDEYIYLSFIYLILLIIFIILLWIFLVIIIIYPNKYIFLIYAIIATLIITYKSYYIIYIYYNNYIDDYKTGIIKKYNNRLYILFILIILSILLWVFLIINGIFMLKYI